MISNLRSTLSESLLRLLLAVWLVVMLTMTFAPSVSANEAILQPSPSDGKDAWISEANPDTTYDDDLLAVGQTVAYGYRGYTLIQFDISSLPSSVSSVKLQLYFYAITSSGCHLSNVSVHQVSSTWDETTVSWDSRPTWAATPVDTFMGTDNTGDLWEWDITSLYATWKSGGDTNHGVVLIAEVTDGWEEQGFYASYETVDSSLRPRLLVTYTDTIPSTNQAPSFAKGADQTVPEDAGAQTVSDWATDISAGPSDESGQTVDFIVTNSNNALFSVQPTISANGTLTYGPAPNANGSATVTVSIHDNGGTANGGVDTSAPQTFTITVTALNDAPTGVADTYHLDRQTTLSVSAPGVLGNDNDIDGDPLSAVLVSTVSHGTLTLSAKGSFTYTAESGFAGNDFFTYKVNDGAADSATVAVAIKVTPPEPPTITSLSNSSGRQGKRLTLVITGTNLDEATALDFGEGITVGTPAATSPSEITIEITIDSDAPLGTRDVTVTTPEGTFTLEDGFAVKGGGGGICSGGAFTATGGHNEMITVLVALGVLFGTGYWLTRRSLRNSSIRVRA